jgi:hypothetical protein
MENTYFVLLVLAAWAVVLGALVYTGTVGH